MKYTRNTIIISVLVAVLCSLVYSKQERNFLDENGIRTINDSDNFNDQIDEVVLSQNLIAFLQDNLKTGEIKIELNCASNPQISNTKAKADPPSIVKGKSANIKVQSQATTAVKVRKLKIACELNGEKVYEQKVDKNVDLNPGQSFVYDYDASVPTFVPQGHFAVKLILIDDSDKELSCLAAVFDF